MLTHDKETSARLIFALGIAIFFALPLGLAGCGDGEEPASEEERIEAVAERFGAIVAAKDTKAFCAILSPLDVQRLGGGETDGKKECLVIWGRAHNPLFKAKDPDLTVTKITKIEPPNATAKLHNGGRLAFLREGGTWYVSLSPGPGQPTEVG